MSKLVLKNVGKSYGNFEAVVDFSLELKTGEFVSLLGPSGCGKTTTLRMIAGHEEASDGDILLGAENITRLPPAARGEDQADAQHQVDDVVHVHRLGDAPVGVARGDDHRQQHQHQAREVAAEAVHEQGREEDADRQHLA